MENVRSTCQLRTACDRIPGFGGQVPDVVIKDLKVKGSSSVVKGGTKVRNIRLTEATDGHNIACKIDGIGAMNLKSEFVKKA